MLRPPLDFQESAKELSVSKGTRAGCLRPAENADKRTLSAPFAARCADLTLMHSQLESLFSLKAEVPIRAEPKPMQIIQSSLPHLI